MTTPTGYVPVDECELPVLLANGLSIPLGQLHVCEHYVWQVQWSRPFGAPTLAVWVAIATVDNLAAATESDLLAPSALDDGLRATERRAE